MDCCCHTTTSFGAPEEPRIVIDGWAGCLITWIDHRSTANIDDDIYAQRLDAFGNPEWTLNGIAVCTANSYQQPPIIVSDMEAGAILVWEDWRFNRDIYAQRVAQDLLVVSPTGGEVFAGSTTQRIHWASFGISANLVDLSYSTDGGATFPNIIASGAVNLGTYDWSLPNLNSNMLRVRLLAKDGAGNSIAEDRSNANFMIDSSPPNNFSLLSPPNGAWTDSLPHFSWQLSGDNLSGLAKHQLWIDQQLNLDDISPLTNSAQPAAPLTIGIHTWFVKTFDRAGNSRQSQQSFSVGVDNIAPAAFNLISPPDSGWTSVAAPAFNWQASSDGESGLSKYQLVIDGIVMIDNISPSQTTITGPSLSSQDHIWKIVANDNAGNTRSSNESRVIRVDAVAPSQPILLSPANNAWTNDQTPEFSWQASIDAGSGLGKYQLYIDGMLKADNIPTSQTTFILPSASILTDGNHTWFVKAVDRLNNTSQSALRTIRVDTQPPNAFSLISPADNSNVSFPTPNFTWALATDAASGLSHYQLWIDDSLSVDNIQGTTSAPSLPLSMGYHTWFVKAIDRASNERNSSENWSVGILVTNVETNDKQTIPTQFDLSQNYPNPFNPETVIEFAIPKPTYVTIKVFNLRGQEIRTLESELLQADYYKVTWDGRDSNGRLVPSGVYLYRLQGADFVATKKLAIIR